MIIDEGNLLLKTWYCPCYDKFHVRVWEEESFLFNPASGDTHLLNALSMKILSLLDRNELSADALVNKLPGVFESNEISLKRDQLIAYLLQFEAMGLIVSSQSCN